MTKLEIGDPVIVYDPGLLALQRFAPKDSRPNNWGWVYEFYEDGDIVVEFPIGDDDPDEHGQIAPYPEYMVKLNPNGTKRERKED